MFDRSASEGMNDTQNSSVQLIDKTVRVLDCFSSERPVLSLSEIRDMVGLPATTVNRLVQSLTTNEVLQSEEGGYRLGVRAMTWSAAATAGSDLIEAAQPTLKDLRNRLGETSGLYVRRGRGRVVVATEMSNQAIVYRAYVGQVLPMHAGAAAWVFLAFDPQALFLTRADEDPAVQAVVANREALDTRLESIRSRGYAFTEGERFKGLNSVAAPVFGKSGGLEAVLAIGAPSFRLGNEEAEAAGAVLVESGQTLSRRLGYKPHHGQNATPRAAGSTK